MTRSKNTRANLSARTPLKAVKAILLLPLLVVVAGLSQAKAMDTPNAPITVQSGALLSAVECLALNIYHEARGESEQGKLAVGHVVLNRSADGKFPRDLCDVVRQGAKKTTKYCQFSWACDGLSDLPREPLAWQAAQRLAQAIYAGETVDPTGGALWYHANYVQPSWQHAFERGPVIGRHVFYRRAGSSESSK
jgi:spore germination cell wall hydrolase CwlJ-like protein